MKGECIIVSVVVLVFSGLGRANCNVPIHSSQLKSLNDEVEEKVYKQAYIKLKSVSARLEASNKACEEKAKQFSQRCERANCGKSNFWEEALQKVKESARKIEKKLKKLVGYERLKKAWEKLKKTWKKLEKPLKNIGKATRKLVRKVGRGVSRVVRRAARNLRRAVRRVKDKIRRVVRVRVRLPRIRYRARFRRFGKKKKRGIAERSICAECKHLEDAKDNEAQLLSLVCGSKFQSEGSRLMNQIEELERLMSSLENENNKVTFVMKVQYDPRSIFYPNGQLSFSKVCVTLSAKSHIWTFPSPDPLILVPFKSSTLTTSFANKILQKYGVN